MVNGSNTMKQLKQSYIDGYKVTMWQASSEHIVSLEYEGAKVYKGRLTLDGANYLFFQYIKDGVQISNEFKN
jgi:hypothetical protein